MGSLSIFLSPGGSARSGSFLDRQGLPPTSLIRRTMPVRGTRLVDTKRHGWLHSDTYGIPSVVRGAARRYHTTPYGVRRSNKTALLFVLVPPLYYYYHTLVCS